MTSPPPCGLPGTRTDSPPRDPLPSISHLQVDLDKLQAERDQQRFTMGTSLNISSAPYSSPTLYTGPPPPYSFAPSTTGSTQNLSGYISPAQSSRRSTRDEKAASPGPDRSLPSIHEALGDKAMTFSMPSENAPSAAPALQPSNSAPPTAVQTFPEPTRMPLSPFSYHSGPPSSTRDSHYIPPNARPPSPRPDAAARRSTFTAINDPNCRPAFPPATDLPPSPQPDQKHSFIAGPQFLSNPHHNRDPAVPRSPREYDPHCSFPYQAQFSNVPGSFLHPGEVYQFGKADNAEDPKQSFARTPSGPAYSEAVKRHLEVYDAELALNEVCDVHCSTGIQWLTG